MNTLVLLIMVCWTVGCGDEGWVLPESEAVAIIREELELRGVDAADTAHLVAGLEVCVETSPCRVVDLALDGWDSERRVGFAYISAEERGLPLSVRVERDEAEAIQAQLDARLESEGVIVVFRRWGHETEWLARDQFRSAVQRALDARGVVEPD